MKWAVIVFASLGEHYEIVARFRSLGEIGEHRLKSQHVYYPTFSQNSSRFNEPPRFVTIRT